MHLVSHSVKPMLHGISMQAFFQQKILILWGGGGGQFISRNYKKVNEDRIPKSGVGEWVGGWVVSGVMRSFLGLNSLMHTRNYNRTGWFKVNSSSRASHGAVPQETRGQDRPHQGAGARFFWKASLCMASRSDRFRESIRGRVNKPPVDNFASECESASLEKVYIDGRNNFEGGVQIR